MEYMSFEPKSKRGIKDHNAKPFKQSSVSEGGDTGDCEGRS